ncbi:MAG: ParB/RepB/Spo0J family partition protein [Candidatus Colwellbacteria bacterium]|nr:ParB/RepB/Spo0J family partition protein [Candidatus Colwellbacteria bacterium]
MDDNNLKEGSHPPPAMLHSEPVDTPIPQQQQPTPVEQPPIKTTQDVQARAGEAVFHIEVDKIVPNPHQPRRDFNEEALRELASSIREHGVIQPLVVSKIERETETGHVVNYELIAGERRLMASKLAGLRTVPAVVRREGGAREKLELAVIENIQREDLNPIETARAFARLQDEFGLTQREIGARLGKSREVVANAVRLLNLPSNIQAAVSERRIGESQARILLSIPDIMEQERMFQEILRDNLSVRELKLRVLRSKPESVKNKAPQPVQTPMNPETLAIKEKLEELLGTKVELREEGDRGRITINFYSKEELQSIIDKIIRQNDNLSL